MIVLDASAVVELLLGGDRAEVVLPWFEAGEGDIHVPGLLDVEVTQAFRRLVADGRMGAERGAAAVEILQDLPLTRHPEKPLLPRLWALRDTLTGYDATYVALAEALDCPLVTFDARLAKAPGPRIRVNLLS